MASLFGSGTSYKSAAPKAAPVAVAVAAAPAPVKMATPAQVQPVDNYSAPAAAPAPAYAAVAQAAESKTVGTAVAQWDFVAETPEEMSFKAGDVIELLECIEGDEWWKGSLQSGAVGLFPSSKRNVVVS